MFEWLIVPSFNFFYFQVHKICLQNSYSITKWMMLEIVVKNISKIMTLSNNLVFVGFKTIILCSVYSI